MSWNRVDRCAYGVFLDTRINARRNEASNDKETMECGENELRGWATEHQTSDIRFKDRMSHYSAVCNSNLLRMKRDAAIYTDRY